MSHRRRRNPNAAQSPEFTQQVDKAAAQATQAITLNLPRPIVVDYKNTNFGDWAFLTEVISRNEDPTDEEYIDLFVRFAGWTREDVYKIKMPDLAAALKELMKAVGEARRNAVPNKSAAAS